MLIASFEMMTFVENFSFIANGELLLKNLFLVSFVQCVCLELLKFLDGIKDVFICIFGWNCCCSTT